MSQTRASFDASARRLASPWAVRAVRLGYAVKGLLYLLVGALSIQFGLGERAAPAGEHEAIRHVGTLPGGPVLIWAVAIGLATFALWKLFEAVANPDRTTTARRLGAALSSFVHGGLAVAAFRLARHELAPSGQDVSRTWTARLLAQPFGTELVALIGAAIVLFGLWQIARSLSGRLYDLEQAAVEGRARRWTRKLGLAGQAARGFVFAIAGIFLIAAALETDPRQTRGLGQVLAALATQPLGTVLLLVVATGLAAYGIYMLVMARYRRVRVV